MPKTKRKIKRPKKQPTSIKLDPMDLLKLKSLAAIDGDATLSTSGISKQIRRAIAEYLARRLPPASVG